MFCVSVADKELSVGCKGLRINKLTGGCVSADFKGDGCLVEWCGRSSTKGYLGLG